MMKTGGRGVAAKDPEGFKCAVSLSGISLYSSTKLEEKYPS